VTSQPRQSGLLKKYIAVPPTQAQTQPEISTPPKKAGSSAGGWNPASIEPNQKTQNVSNLPKVGETFRDCPDCPEMVVIPAGSFMMGSSAGEQGRFDNEGPEHNVSIKSFAISKYEVTVGEFRRFVQSTGYRTDAEANVGNSSSGCYSLNTSDRKWDWLDGRHWDNPGFSQTERHPVTCISWNDAQDYLKWLVNNTGKPYRLPSEAEWEYAARAGSTTSRPWGDDPNDACIYANIADKTNGPNNMGWTNRANCSDGNFFTAPVGSFQPNFFGLYDMIGNVWEWTEDCWSPSYNNAPMDGGPWILSQCSNVVSRNSGWDSLPIYTRTAIRGHSDRTYRNSKGGIRLSRSLP